MPKESNKTSLSKSDLLLFNQALKGVTPLRENLPKKITTRLPEISQPTAKPSKEEITDELDFQLFRQAMEGTTEPLQHDKVVHPVSKTKPLKKPSSSQQASAPDILSDQAEMEAIQPTDVLSYADLGIQKRTFRKLRRGQLITIDTLDLHGLNLVQSKKLLLDFLQQALQVEGSCVLVIHGKGNRSGNKEPVLKRYTNHWLKQHPRVLAFHSAQLKDGGTGAVYLLLRTSQLPQ